jgi:PAS domain S-box-containing protein
MRASEGEYKFREDPHSLAIAACDAAVAALDESESTLRAFYEGSTLMMLLVERADNQLRIVSCNPAFASAFGKTAHELKGVLASEFVRREAYISLWTQHCEEVERARKTLRFEWHFGEGLAMRWFAATVSAVERPKGRRFCIVAEETTERMRLQTQLLLADRLVSVGTLAAGVAHEINNPLTYVIANLEYVARLMADETSDPLREKNERVSRALKQAREGTERVRLIVRNLRTFSRGDEERRGPVSVREVIESAIDMSWNEIRHRAQLVRDYQSVPLVEANEARLGQVFLNLLVNAAQAIPEGNVDAHCIRIGTRYDNHRVRIEISDTGVGIPAENIKRIFDPFFTTKAVGDGTGLGLSVCHGIVTALGGEIRVESTPGHGTVFSVLLPATEKPRAVAVPSRPSPAAGSRARVLIVDDEHNLRISLRQLVALENDVKDTASGNDVLELIRSGERFDVILCDLMMPEMSGVDVYHQLMKIAPDQAEKIVFLTGGAFTPRTQEFLASVKNRRMEKPFDVDELLLMIRTMVTATTNA